MSIKRINGWMRADLDRYLNVTSKLDSQWMPCYRLIQLQNSNQKFSYKGPLQWIDFENDTLKSITGYTIDVFINALNTFSESSHGLFVDSTGYTGLIDLQLKIDKPDDIKALTAALEPYGLGLQPASQKFLGLTITDQDKED